MGWLVQRLFLLIFFFYAPHHTHWGADFDGRIIYVKLDEKA